ncbi:hypothetical protein ACFQH2_16555 [Natronoarchaeum sp. GCM10025703]|uniref:hypothetical protein n=1 Tax=unclassified Natronoarchaeum TaxID=2620183 RepID=UPI00361ABC06
MADDRNSRDKQARDADERQRQRELTEAVERGDEKEPPREEVVAEPPQECHRRGCTESPDFVVVERYQEETGHGAVEATAFLCREHTREESPANLDGVYPGYRFRVEPLSSS